MGALEIIGGILLIVVAVIVIVAVTAQEGSKGGLGTISGETGSFFDRNRGKTKEAMLIRATAISGVVMAVLTLVVLFASMR